MLSFSSLSAHTLCTASVGLCLAALLSGVALIIKQEQRTYVLLLLIVLPATAAAVFLPFLVPRPLPSFWVSAVQGTLLSPLLAVTPLVRLRNIPSTWTLTAQELGANGQMRLRFLWLPLLRKPLLLSLLLAFVLGLTGAVCLLKASLP
ncbi:hypothetical protein [Acetobacter tropicalis]|uniref:ABC transmembrane type-1 domain-containing protein n=1 Tax=Acetobacter tropicalis TaxID=104102 RepID=A0A252A6D3_9PROT|nr:hypothetical protein [Acetobacter tropicalis]OUI85155.1 hypothetical protein HC62_12195 [Acetobacter tropicalis]